MLHEVPEFLPFLREKVLLSSMNTFGIQKLMSELDV